MKKGWITKDISDIADIINGGTPDTSIKKYWDGDNLWITPKDLGTSTSKYIYDTQRKISELGLINSSAKVLPKNSIVLSSRAPIGYLAINKKELSTNQGCKGLIPKPNINSLFLYYFLSSSVTLLNDLGSGTTFKELSTSKLASVKIPVPPLPEQKCIVSILDKAFTAIDKAKRNAEKNLQNSKELFETYLQGVFSNPGKNWEEKTIEDIAYIINGGTPDTSNKKYWGGDNLWITPKDMGKLSDIYIYDTERKISVLGLEHSSAKLIPRNSIILSSRAPIGHLAINKKEISTNQGCKGIVPKSKIVSLYLYYFLKKSVKLLNDIGSGTTFKELSTAKLAKVRIPVPDIIEQKNLVKELDTLLAKSKKLQEIYEQKLANLEELKKSILQKAFNGEL